MWGFGRAIALWGFNAVQQIGADIDSDQFWSVLTATVAVMVTSQLSCQMYYASSTRVAGLVQIANALIEHTHLQYIDIVVRQNNDLPSHQADEGAFDVA